MLIPSCRQAVQVKSPKNFTLRVRGFKSHLETSSTTLSIHPFFFCRESVTIFYLPQLRIWALRLNLWVPTTYRYARRQLQKKYRSNISFNCQERIIFVYLVTWHKGNSTFHSARWYYRSISYLASFALYYDVTSLIPMPSSTIISRPLFYLLWSRIFSF